uniref:Uncharacterized protein n=1 Tax=Cacopsylla melanoneura TaxID=428564 RepID=A0A8D8ZE57_9HEMI
MQRQYASTRARSALYVQSPRQSYTRRYPSSEGCTMSMTTFDPGTRTRCKPHSQSVSAEIKCGQQSKIGRKPATASTCSRKCSTFESSKNRCLIDLDFRNPCPCCRKQRASLKQVLNYYKDMTLYKIQRKKTTWAANITQNNRDLCCVCSCKE